MSAIFAAALAYAERGWAVFPCKAGEKVPATRRGFKDATVDLYQIRAWWSRNPDFNVGVPTGANSVDVLDVDCKPAGTGFPALNRLIRAGLVTGANALVGTRPAGCICTSSRLAMAIIHRRGIISTCAARAVT